MGSLSINGVSFSGNSIEIKNGKVIIDGVVQGKATGRVEVIVTGSIGHLSADGSVTVHGDVLGDVKAGNSVDVEGDILGNVDAGNSVHAEKIKGNVDAGNSVIGINEETRRNWF